MAADTLSKAIKLVESSGIKYATKEELADAVDFIFARLVKLEEKEAERMMIG